MTDEEFHSKNAILYELSMCGKIMAGIFQYLSHCHNIVFNGMSDNLELYNCN